MSYFTRPTKTTEKKSKNQKRYAFVSAQKIFDQKCCTKWQNWFLYYDYGCNNGCGWDWFVDNWLRFRYFEFNVTATVSILFSRFDFLRRAKETNIVLLFWKFRKYLIALNVSKISNPSIHWTPFCQFLIPCWKIPKIIEACLDRLGKI